MPTEREQCASEDSLSYKYTILCYMKNNISHQIYFFILCLVAFALVLFSVSLFLGPETYINQRVQNHDQISNISVLDLNNSFTQTKDIEKNLASITSTKPVFNQIGAITGDLTHYIYIADTGNQCIQKINSQGVVNARWGGFGFEPGKFNDIRGITTDHLGYVYVADSGNNRIQKFDSSGRFVSLWGEYGSGPGKFIGISAIGIGLGNEAGEEYVYVADTGNKKVQIFDTSGAYINSWGEYGTFNPDMIPESLDRLQIITGIQYPESYIPISPIPGADPAEVDRNFKISFKKSEFTITIPVNRSIYLGAKQNVAYLPDIGTGSPEYWIDFYISLYKDPINNITFDAILKALRDIRDMQALNDREYIELLVTFVQQIPFKEGEDTRYPIEVIHDKKGNSADKALLLLGLLEREGYLTTYIYFPSTGFCGIGIGKDPIHSSSSLAEFSTKDRNTYIFINPNEPTLIGLLDKDLLGDDPFLIKFSNTTEQGNKLYDHVNFLDHVVGTYFLLDKRLQYFENQYKTVTNTKEKKLWEEKYEKTYEVFTFIKDHPYDIGGSYTRIKNSKVREMEF